LSQVYSTCRLLWELSLTPFSCDGFLFYCEVSNFLILESRCPVNDLSGERKQMRKKSLF
jgi:hypothetical protein